GRRPRRPLLPAARPPHRAQHPRSAPAAPPSPSPPTAPTPPARAPAARPPPCSPGRAIRSSRRFLLTIFDGSPTTLPSGTDGQEGPPTYKVLRATGQPRTERRLNAALGPR